MSKSKTITRRTRRVFTNEEKCHHVCEYFRSGIGIVAYAKQHDVLPSALSRWVISFSQDNPNQLERMPKMKVNEDLSKENQQLRKEMELLRKELSDAKFRAHALDTMIDVAEEMFDIPIRKKAGTKQ